MHWRYSISAGVILQIRRNLCGPVCAVERSPETLEIASVQWVHQIEEFFAGIGGLGDFPMGCYLLTL